MTVKIYELYDHLEKEKLTGSIITKGRKQVITEKRAKYSVALDIQFSFELPGSQCSLFLVLFFACSYGSLFRNYIMFLLEKENII